MSSFADQEFLCENDEVGDCWRACIANLYSRPIARVPHFVEQFDQQWLDATNEWLDREYHERLQAFPPRTRWFRRWSIPRGCRPCVILVGRSPRASTHAVLADARSHKVVHDPHPSRDGLHSVIDVYVPRAVRDE